MSKEPVERRFLFTGNAVALAAHIRRPQDLFIPAVASSSLPVTGGLAEAKSDGQSFEIISYESASTRAIGDFSSPQRALDFTHGNHGENDLPATTFVESTVSGLKIQVPARTFLAQQLRIDMESTSDRRGPNTFRSLNAVIEGVSVDGCPIKIKTDTKLFSENETKEKLCRAYEQSRDFRKRYSKQFFPTGRSSNSGCFGWLFGAKNRIPEGDGLICGTFVTGMEWEAKKASGTEMRGNRLIIEGLGSIYFGEIVIEEGVRRVTLVRFQLGSPNGGDGAVCEATTNGHTWPPRIAGS